MCGICGFVSRQQISLEQLRQMNDTMRHRGPNDSGEEIFAGRDGYSVAGCRSWICQCWDTSPCTQVMTGW